MRIPQTTPQLLPLQYLDKCKLTKQSNQFDSLSFLFFLLLYVLHNKYQVKSHTTVKKMKRLDWIEITEKTETK